MKILSIATFNYILFCIYYCTYYFHAFIAAPVFTLPLSDQYLDEGGKMQLLCEAIGKPLPSYKWYRSGIEFKPGSLGFDKNRYSISSFGNKLTVTNLVKEDSQTYQCAAENQLGISYTTANVRVLGIFGLHLDASFTYIIAFISSNKICLFNKYFN